MGGDGWEVAARAEVLGLGSGIMWRRTLKVTDRVVPTPTILTVTFTPHLHLIFDPNPHLDPNPNPPPKPLKKTVPVFSKTNYLIVEF